MPGRAPYGIMASVTMLHPSAPTPRPPPAAARTAGERSTLVAGSDRGFTLLELMIVTVIVGILAAVAAQVMGGVRESASAAVVVSDIRRLPLVVEPYLAEHGEFPGDVSELKAAGFRTSENVCITEYEVDQAAGTVEIRLRYRGQDVFSSWVYPEEGAPEAPDDGPPPWSNGRRSCLDGT